MLHIYKFVRLRCSTGPALNPGALAVASLLLSFQSPALLPGQTIATPGNAALTYFRAYAAIQQAKGIPDVRSLVENYASVPLDSNAIAAISAADRALLMLQSGVSLRHCDWGISVDEGVDADTSHRGVVRELTGMLGLRARLRLANGSAGSAASDVLAGISITRHLSSDGSPASALIAWRLENDLAGMLVMHFDSMRKSDLTAILEGLQRVPAGSTPRAAFLSQIRISHDRLVSTARAARTREDLAQKLTAWPMLGAKAAEFLNACGGTADGMIRAAEEVATRAGGWVKEFDMPPPEFEKTFLVKTADLRKRNPVFQMLTPSVPRIQREDAIVRVRRTMFRATVAVRRDGIGALPHYPDPHSGRAFLQVGHGQEIRLQSRLVVNGRAVELTNRLD